MTIQLAARLAMVVFLSLSLPAMILAQNPEGVITNDLGMTFVLIDAGTFMMGSHPGEPYRDPGETQHRVTLTKPYYLQTTEVTVGQWHKIMDKGMFAMSRRAKGSDNLPMTRIGWHDVQSFLEKINSLGDERYRLPTEAEWEYAARAGTSTLFHWGNQFECERAMFANNYHKYDQCRDYALSRHLPTDGPAPVKSYAPNAWGLYDMHGNVWEWCQDRFGPYPENAVRDPQGPARGTYRVRRGGSWFAGGHICRSPNRAYGHPASRLRTTGFRIVRMVAN